MDPILVQEFLHKRHSEVRPSPSDFVEIDPI